MNSTIDYYIDIKTLLPVRYQIERFQKAISLYDYDSWNLDSYIKPNTFALPSYLPPCVNLTDVDMSIDMFDY